MRLNLIILFCLFIFTIKSQELNYTKLLPPESQETSDLSFLKTELKDKQVVMLGEQTHMYGNIFEMKARIVKYLHQELGFTTIAIESSMFDIWKMNKTGFNPNNFNKSIWGVWSNSYEFQRLVKYIDENNLKVIGFDSQVMNVPQFIDDFFDYLENEKIDLKLDEDDSGIMIEAILDNFSVEEDDISYKNYEKELKRIISKLEDLEPIDENYHWLQFTKSLLACSQDAFYNKDEILTTDFGNKNDNIRDKQMADNLLSYINRNPEQKIICWGDNIHFMNDNSSITKPVAQDFISMGSYVYNALKGKSYSLATIHANDSLFDYGINKWHLTPLKENSFEHELKSLKTPFLFVSSNQEKMRSIKHTRLLNFVDFTEARLDQLHDGYVFFKNATLPQVKKINDSTSRSKKASNLKKKIGKLQVDKNISLKGQILDKNNKDIVPFATLVLKNKEIYRVADEDGFFEFTVKQQDMPNKMVEISSLGYETIEIPLDDLNEKIYLKPKFEELDEVVIKAYLSPLTVLKKAVKNKRENHPSDGFNFYRYAKVVKNVNDEVYLDMELFAKQHDDGYTSPFRITHKVEEVKWNVDKSSNKYNSAYQLFPIRENAIRYSNILHKRKYKKFSLKFVKEYSSENENNYIIAFETQRDKWNYTNRNYPTSYSGRVYIDKERFAITKVVEHWETHLSQGEVDKHLLKENPDYYKHIKDVIIKEEHISTYKNVLTDYKYYATEFFNRKYYEAVKKDNKKIQQVNESTSYFFDFETENVEDIEYEHLGGEKSSLSKSVNNEDFWNNFYNKKINSIND